MNYWRMAFRFGSDGYEMWPHCVDHKVASIGYWVEGKPVVGDCSSLTPEEFDREWAKRWPRSGSAKSSVKQFRFGMEKGDVIYVKQGPSVVCRGVIKSDYWYDPDLYTELSRRFRWMHHRRVDWDISYPSVSIVLGADRSTVLKLNPERLRALRSAELSTGSSLRSVYAMEGEMQTSEAKFRQRNRALIEAKKAGSSYKCEACGLRLEDHYGVVGRHYIVAHHIRPIGERRRASRTTLDDIALVCPNCHEMLHRENPPHTIDWLRQKMGK